MKDHRKERAEARKKAEKLVSQMTILEKASQLKYDAAPVKRLGVPAYNYWNEALHGVARAGVATMFPQCRRFALDKADRIHWTDRQTVAKPVAVIVPDQLCFSVYDGDRALVARLRTQAAARAGRLVDFDDRPFHACPSCCFWASNLARRSASAFS